MTGKIHVPIILVGNKVDLQLERCVSTQEGRELANFMKAQFAEVRYKWHIIFKISSNQRILVPRTTLQ